MARDYSADIRNIISTTWKQSAATSVPSTENVALSGGAKIANATFLYADLANSSRIARHFDRRIAAKIIKSFLQCATHLVLQNNGRVISFDGDRILGVFMEGNKNTNAAKCGLMINDVVSRKIRPIFESHYDSVRNASFRISHGVGIDTGEVLIVRGGVRGNNDLISIGRAPNLAAKLSDLRETDHKTFITESVFNSMLDEAKFADNPKRSMWEKRTWTFLGETLAIYRSRWFWRT